MAHLYRVSGVVQCLRHSRLNSIAFLAGLVAGPSVLNFRGFMALEGTLAPVRSIFEMARFRATLSPLYRRNAPSNSFVVTGFKSAANTLCTTQYQVGKA